MNYSTEMTSKIDHQLKGTYSKYSYIGSSNHTTKTEPESIDLTLIDEIAPTAKEFLKEILKGLVLPYTATATAASKVQVSIEENQRIETISNMINRMQINKMKNAFC